MQTVKTVDGREARVVDEGDLLMAERAFRRWMIGIICTIVLASLFIGQTYAQLAQHDEQTAARIEEVRTEGSLPLQEVKADIAAIRTQQDVNSRMLIELNRKLDRVR